MPNTLLPNNNNNGTMRPRSGPEIYQGQGPLINSIIFVVFLKDKKSLQEILTPQFNYRLPAYFSRIHHGAGPGISKKIEYFTLNTTTSFLQYFKSFEDQTEMPKPVQKM